MNSVMRILHVYFTRILFVVGLVYVYLTYPCPSCDAKAAKGSTAGQKTTIKTQEAAQQGKTTQEMGSQEQPMPDATENNTAENLEI